MTTTALYVELIVIGAQVEFWILILLEAFNRKLFDSIFHATDNAFIIIAALIPAYVLGMIFDRFADKVFSKRPMLPQSPSSGTHKRPRYQLATLRPLPASSA